MDALSDEREQGTEQVFSVLGIGIRGALRRYVRRHGVSPPNPKHRDFQVGSQQRVLLIQGLGTHSGEAMLDELADSVPQFSPAQYSYRGRIHPTYDEVDSIRGVRNIAQAAALIDEYFPTGTDETRLIIAHSLGGVVAYEWAWRRRHQNAAGIARTRLFLLASPVFLSIPRSGRVLKLTGHDGAPASMLIRATSFPPNRLPSGIDQVGAAFCEDDDMAPQSVCRLPGHPRAVNFPPQPERHATICTSDKSKEDLHQLVDGY